MPPHDHIPRSEQSSVESLTDGRSLTGLFRELSRETRMLVRQEISLAKTEISEKASEAGRDVALVGAGGAVAYVGFIVLVMGLAILLGSVIADWLAFVITGVVVALIGYALAQKGLSALRRMDFKLTKTTETLQEDKQWMKEEAKEVKQKSVP